MIKTHRSESRCNLTTEYRSRSLSLQSTKVVSNADWEWKKENQGSRSSSSSSNTWEACCQQPLAVRGPWAWRILNRLSAAGCTCSPRLDTFTGLAFPPPPPPAAFLANSLTAVANISIYPALLSPSLCLRPSSLRLSLSRSLSPKQNSLSLERPTRQGFCNASAAAGTAISRWTSNECTSLHPHCKTPKPLKHHQILKP